ncbi:LOW QUALITY PROTEIN: von Willebrand factor A domain-containing protein 3B-like [Narcine bancroftii]|uniref:LOW QUALITY PROTEIN: von Willebrand factor A domain-containing protein 3B-like n=1 Tax=Narcine bancroftii TaxID=1343680 RepID=UPI0038318B70
MHHLRRLLMEIELCYESRQLKMQKIHGKGSHSEHDVHALLPSSKWLQLHGIKRSRLTLSQILSQIGFKHREDFDRRLQKSVSSCYGEGLFYQYLRKDGRIYNVSAGITNPKDITDKALSISENIYREHCCQRAATVIKDLHHPAPTLFSQRPSVKKEYCRCHKIHTTRFRNSCYRSTIRLLNHGRQQNYNEEVYRRERDQLVEWCHTNNLALNVSKPKEMIVDFRRKSEEHKPILIESSAGGRVKTFKFLVVNISEVLTWDLLVDAITKKAFQLLHLDRKNLRRADNSASDITDTSLHSNEHISKRRSLKKAASILKEPHQLAHALFTLLPLGMSLKTSGSILVNLLYTLSKRTHPSHNEVIRTEHNTLNVVTPKIRRVAFATDVTGEFRVSDQWVMSGESLLAKLALLLFSIWLPSCTYIGFYPDRKFEISYKVLLAPGKQTMETLPFHTGEPVNWLFNELVKEAIFAVHTGPLLTDSLRPFTLTKRHPRGEGHLSTLTDPRIPPVPFTLDELAHRHQIALGMIHPTYASVMSVCGFTSNPPMASEVRQNPELQIQSSNVIRKPSAPKARSEHLLVGRMFSLFLMRSLGVCNCPAQVLPSWMVKRPRLLESCPKGDPTSDLISSNGPYHRAFLSEQSCFSAFPTELDLSGMATRKQPIQWNGITIHEWGGQCRPMMVRKIIEDAYHPTHSIFQLLPSGKRATEEMDVWQEKAVPVSSQSIASAVDWIGNLTQVPATSKTSSAEAVSQATTDKTIDAVYYFTAGDGPRGLRELLRQKLANSPCPVHVISFNAQEEATVRFLKELAHCTSGRFHAFALMNEIEEEEISPTNGLNGTDTEVPKIHRKLIGGVPPGAGVREDVFLIWCEIEEARNTLAEVQTIVAGALRNMFAAETLSVHQPKEPSRTEDWISSKKWLDTCGLKAHKLTFYDVLADCAFRHSDGIVNIKGKPVNECIQTDAESRIKLVNAKYCGQFVHTLWKDGSVMHVHITAEKCKQYKKRMKIALEQMQQRINWLCQGSKELFGTIIEDQIYILVDTSQSMKDKLELVQKKIFQLMQEQLRHKTKFNFVKFGSRAEPWRQELAEVNEKNLENAWSWIKGLQVGGSTNTLGALRLAFADTGTQAVYILSDGRPDQSPQAIFAQVLLVHPVPIHSIAFNCDDVEANKFLYQLSEKTDGRFHSYSCDIRGSSNPPPFSEDVYLLKKEIEKGKEDLEKVEKLHAECIMLDWYHNREESGSNNKYRLLAVHFIFVCCLVRQAHYSCVVNKLDDVVRAVLSCTVVPSAAQRRVQLAPCLLFYSAQLLLLLPGRILVAMCDSTDSITDSGLPVYYRRQLRGHHKARLLHADLDAVSDEHGERFHQGTVAMEKQHKLNWNPSMLADSSWAVKQQISFSSDKPISFRENKEALLQALDRMGWPIPQEDVTLLEDEIYTGYSYEQQASDLQKAAKVKKLGTMTDACRKQSRSVKKATKLTRRILDALRGQKVVARSEVDGFYYPGIITRCAGITKVLIDFTKGVTQITSIQSLIQIGGAVPCPPLKVGDFVLVRCNAKSGNDCYKPGVIITPPNKRMTEDKFYTVLKYNNEKEHSFRNGLIKISSTQYSFINRYIREAQMTDHTIPSVQFVKPITKPDQSQELQESLSSSGEGWRQKLRKNVKLKNYQLLRTRIRRF